MRKLNINKAYTALFFSMMFWGLSFVWTRQLLVVFSPLLIIFIRLFISLIILWLVAKLSHKLQRIQKKDYLYIFLLSITQPFLYFIFEGYGIKYTSASIASIIIATIPLFTPIGAYLFFRDKLSNRNIIGLVISFIGVIFVVADFGKAYNFSWFGILMLFSAVIMGALYGLGLKRLTTSYNSITITTIQNLFGLLLFLPLILIYEWQNIISLPDLLNLDLLFAFFNLALFASSIAFVLFAYGISKIGPSKASAFSNSIPIFTIIFAYFVLNENIGLIKLIGMSIVLLGLFLSQKESQV